MHPSPTASPTAVAGRYNAAYVWTVASVGALGGLLFGYDWVVIGGAKPFYVKYFQLASEDLIGWDSSPSWV
jgi:MFS transporter, SP family, xylose:H+ symportor